MSNPCYWQGSHLPKRRARGSLSLLGQHISTLNLGFLVGFGGQHAVPLSLQFPNSDAMQILTVRKKQVAGKLRQSMHQVIAFFYILQNNWDLWDQ